MDLDLTRRVVQRNAPLGLEVGEVDLVDHCRRRTGGQALVQLPDPVLAIETLDGTQEVFGLLQRLIKAIDMCFDPLQ